MKILHIITSLQVGGAQKMLQQLLNHWKIHNDQHMVISLVNGGSVAKEIVALHIPVYELKMQPGKPYLSELLKLLFTIQSYKPDLIQTWLYHSDLIGGVIAKLSSHIPIVWGIHHTISNNGDLKHATSIVSRFNSLLSRYIPSRIVCCSDTARDTHVKLGYQVDKMLVIPNAVDTTRFRPDLLARLKLRRSMCLPESTKVIGMFARFHPQKDHHNFILAARFLQEELPDVHFILAGEGMEHSNAQLQELINSEGLNKNFHLLGLRKDMPFLYAAIDICTLSSSGGEAFPLMICEAMACGIPCVATNVGDIAKIIGDSGCVVPVQDPLSLAKAWKWILNKPAFDYARLGKLAREIIEEKYNLDIISDHYHKLYMTVVNER